MTTGETIDFTVTFNEMNKKIIDDEIEDITKRLTSKLLEYLKIFPKYGVRNKHHQFNITRNSHGFIITDISMTSHSITHGIGTNLCAKLNEKLTAAGVINFQTRYEHKYLDICEPNITVSIMKTDNSYN